MTKVLLSHIPEDQALREEGIEVSVESLGLEAPFRGAIRLAYELRKFYGKVLGKFEVGGMLELECSRCLRHFEAPYQNAFVLQFEKRPEDANPRNVDPEDPEPHVVFFEGDEIDFSEDLRQELELLVPFAPRCQEDCKGLCPQCGCNWNLSRCQCAEDRPKGPFGALRKLFPKDKEQ